jgi:hypothetical protein
MTRSGDREKLRRKAKQEHHRVGERREKHSCHFGLGNIGPRILEQKQRYQFSEPNSVQSNREFVFVA